MPTGRTPPTGPGFCRPLCRSDRSRARAASRSGSGKLIRSRPPLLKSEPETDDHRRQPASASQQASGAACGHIAVDAYGIDPPDRTRYCRPLSGNDRSGARVAPNPYKRSHLVALRPTRFLQATAAHLVAGKMRPMRLSPVRDYPNLARQPHRRLPANKTGRQGLAFPPAEARYVCFRCALVDTKEFLSDQLLEAFESLVVLAIRNELICGM